MANHIGAIDQGTTSTRFIVFDRSGRIVTTAQKEHEQIYPKPGWVEHNPEEIWARTQEVIAEALKAKNLTAKDLAGVGITNQRETTVVWNRKTGKPVYNAHRMAGYPHRRLRRRVLPSGRTGPVPPQDRTAPGNVLQRIEDQVDPGKRSGRPSPG